MTPININPSIARVYVLMGAYVINSVPEYLARIQTLLYAKNNENATVDIVGPRWHPRGVDWRIVSFRARIRFIGGQVLEISDKFSRESFDGWTRNFSYYLGVQNGDEMERVFLFDTHGLFGGQGHFHPEDDERLMAGDARLNGFSPEDIDIADVLDFIDLYFEGKPFPWVAA